MTSTKYNGPPKVISLINAVSPYKKAGSIHDKSPISFTVTGFANPTISAVSCAVKICSVGNFRNQLPFYIKTYIFSDKLIVTSVSDGGSKLKKSEFNHKYSEIIF